MPRSRRLRNTLKTLLVVAVLLGGIVALNWPITFATVHLGATAAPVATPSTQDSSVADVAARANPAVVTITNYQPQRNPFTGEPEGAPVPYGKGSGYIIDTEGHVVTNSHVVEGGTAFTVEFADGTTVDAKLIGQDPFQDVAVLQLDLKAGQTVPGTVTLGNSDTVRPGDHVIAIGSPYGEFTNTVSDGTVGAVHRSLDTGYYRLPNLIQHSAPIYEGNSGGPLLNMQGEVIGMNAAKAVRTSLGGSEDTGIGFAIEINAVKEIVNQILQNGKVLRPYLGIIGQPVEGGHAIAEVESGTPADQAGLQPGDVITSVDGTRIDEQHPFLNLLIFNHKPGDTVELGVYRNGRELTVTVTLGERPSDLS